MVIFLNNLVCDKLLFAKSNAEKLVLWIILLLVIIKNFQDSHSEMKVNKKSSKVDCCVEWQSTYCMVLDFNVP